MEKQSKRLTGVPLLREPAFYILLSLSPGNRHGYGIMKDVEEFSQGKVGLSTATLYEALARLLDQGLIERVPGEETGVAGSPDDLDHPGKPRKSYRLTKTGRWVLEAETARLKKLVTIAQRRLGDEGR